MRPLLLTLCLFIAACEFGGSTKIGGPVIPPAFPEIALLEFATGFIQPTDVTGPRDGSNRLFIAERAGVIRVIQSGELVQAPFLDISDRVGSSGGEQGLLGIAFPAAGLRGTGQFYVHYTDTAGNTVISRFRTTGQLGAVTNTADPDSEEIILQVAQPFANHNGGTITFGPGDLLYIALGDGGGSGDPLDRAQDLDSLLGKILRIDVEDEDAAGPYSIPEDNPFDDEIWAYGLRNPWRLSFDIANGDMFIGDVGESTIEEVNHQPRDEEGGINYGWPIMEGSECFSEPNCDDEGLTLPVFEYEHSGGDCAITGGFVYRANSIFSLRGIYVFGDFCSGRISGLAQHSERWVSGLLLDTDLQISTFGQDDFAELYVADYATGVIYRLVPPPPE